MAKEYDDKAVTMRDRLNAVSPSFCLAKWLQVSLHLPQGMTQSCYHPPTHPIPLEELEKTPAALHNTVFKIHERKQMIAGERPEGCSYCWKYEDAEAISDRHFRSSEFWAEPDFDKVVNGPIGTEVLPRYVEVNFNQACNFKCMYCSPHLSTTWEEDIKRFGPYELNGFEHNNLDALRMKGMMPLKVATKDNPYITAFWNWWPEIYRNLRVFRMTGGEPLMDKNTFSVLDYVNSNPHGQLELSITSNLCPPKQELMVDFVAAVKRLEEIRVWEDKENFNKDSGNYWYVAPAAKHFILFVSVDGYGEQAEYIRSGLNFDVMLENVRYFLRNTSNTSVSFINTMNILSLPSLNKFLEMILELREEFGGRNQTEFELVPPSSHGIAHQPYKFKKFQRIWFDISALREPNWFSVKNAGQYGIDTVEQNLSYMKDNLQKLDYDETFEGFKPFEILKLKYILEYMKIPENEAWVENNKANFVRFIVEYDKRNGFDFEKTFPELIKE